MGEAYVKGGFLVVVYFIFLLQALLPVLRPELPLALPLWFILQGILLVLLVFFSFIFWSKTGRLETEEPDLREPALQRDEKVLSAGETVGMVVHELRKPISRLRLRLEEEGDKEELGEIPAELDQLTETIKKVEKIFQAQQFESRWQPLPRFLSELYQGQESNFKIVTRAGISWLQVDTQQLKIALQNLIDNSVEAYERSGREGKILLHCRKLGPEICISVEDQAGGMEPGLARVINGKAAPDEHYGMGLGLALTKKICRNHRGRMMVESEPEEGSRVTLTIPCV